MSAPVPLIKPRDGFADAFGKAIGAAHIATKQAFDELTITVTRDGLVEAARLLRDEFGYQQLMEIAGVDYPNRAERFEVNYHFLSVTENHRVRLKVTTEEDVPISSLTGLWPVAGWLEREVFDMYGVIFAGHPDLRRILTDYGFEGYPLRKDFPQTGYVELRYSEAEKRVIYEPVKLAQDFRNFDFLMPWEGPDYQLPGDEKATVTPAPPPPTPKTTENRSQTGAGKPAEKQSNEAASKSPTKKASTPKPSNKAEPKPVPAKGAATKPKPRKKKGDA